MSYQFAVTPQEISISPEAIKRLRWDLGLRPNDLHQLLERLECEFSLEAQVTGYSAEGQPELSFELLGFSSPEREGLEGIIEQLKWKLKYADAQSFTITDENGRTATYDHPGFSA